MPGVILQTKRISIWPLFFLALFFFGCKNSEQLKELEPLRVHDYGKTKVDVNFCTTPANQVKTYLKFIFVLDKSGSNQRRILDITGDGVPDSGAEVIGTDPEGSRRYAPIVGFLESIPEDDSIFYSLVDFSTAASVVSAGLSHPSYSTFSNNKAAFADLINTQWSNTATGDSGATNYTAAVAAVKAWIQSDITAAKTAAEIISSYYVIFFVSDGAPWIPSGALTIQQTLPEIQYSIDSLKSLTESNPEWIDSVQVHTGYYFSPYIDLVTGLPVTGDDPDARLRLSDMAARSSGEFLEFASGQQIDFTKFSIPERNLKNSLKDILVINRSTLWDKGEIFADSDGDGLSDQWEGLHSSSSATGDSDADGLSDFVEYRLTNGVSATSRSRSCGVHLTTNDADGDTLNDCEEYMLQTALFGGVVTYQSFDSNNDWIPDDIALRYNLSVISNVTDEAKGDQDFDRLDNYEEIKLNTPLNFDNHDIYGLVPMNYSISVVSDGPLQTCYSLDVGDIIEGQDQSLIRVYIFEQTSIIRNKKFIRVSEKAVRNGNTVVFNDEDFN
ncbi:MAG: hypothetical protein A2504_17590 [Bdellovibrionales bacterium RIFOXYD12_FULL_39_22]|nr:MAG: hypothetical protein A2385_15290 [Bdellovibrionales bacterium RIFOXYB1_FULL_39_21]OFZ40627.1 MAG: hypothetical protein A2485_03475 [Bdellovibrionales bacterium RIFOXYC12_FULL_39_17]OFZ50425.1 MAG: hypothetical protein A2404_02590 [Bdellovibrionales bacterium RIFOXYC1_FULL_39_130]OFZ71286.1 MAG: hypothetical protein A2451_00820 [Bdellovibrionales bacterium RIFOXYC2_FULL_39_8]OFZ77684.1 MAG: hypothetical protein A2560_04960 [Bdellovibrionales bacterium RIFOXYD1_FULL_39_84]OFZ91718.1 MAG: